MHGSTKSEDQPFHVGSEPPLSNMKAQALPVSTSHPKDISSLDPATSQLTVPSACQSRPQSPASVSVASADDSLYRVYSGRAPRKWKGRLQAGWIRNKGILMMLCAQFFGTLMNVTTRLLETEGNKGKGLHPFQILFARMSITFLLASAYMWWRKTAHFPLGLPEVRWLLVARGLFGFWGVFGMYFSLLYLPLADATVITFLAPALACWACSILIHQPFTRCEQIAAFVSILGIVIIARPTTLLAILESSTSGEHAGTSNHTISAHGHATDYDQVTPTQRLTAVGIALVGVLGTAGAYTTIRWIGKRAHPLISVNYFAFWCFTVSIVMQAVLPDVGFLLPADLKEWGYLIFLGTCGFIMQFLLAAGLSYEKSSRTTNMTYTQMLFALLFDKLIFNHIPGATSILGSSLILGSAITVALQEPTPAPGPKPNSRMQQINTADEESQRGLLHDMGHPQDITPLPVQEVQLRTLQ